jgi:hypothetical protein
VYKQLMASFGTFSMDTLAASTRGISSNTAGDQQYLDTRAAIDSLTNERNTLAAHIRTGLNDAQFNNVKLSENQIEAWTAAGEDLLARADALANGS